MRLTAFYIFLLICLLGCADYQARSKKIPPTFTNEFCSTQQSMVGDELNLVRDGAWFGRHTNKIVRSGKQLFTYVMPNITSPKQIILYSKEDGKDWVEGETIYVSRPPDILIDSIGFIHVVGYQSFDVSDDGPGRLFHVKFENPLSVVGAFKFEFISPDWRTMVIDSTLLSNTGSTRFDLLKRINSGWLPKIKDSIYSTYYSGATIDDRNNIHVLYCSSQTGDTFHSISERIYDAQAEKWSYSLLLDSLPQRLCYPYSIRHDDKLHIVMVEDQYDERLEVTGYPYRYGKVIYTEGSVNTGNRTQEVLINLNDSLSDVMKIQSHELRVADFYISSSDTLHILVRLNREQDYKNLHQQTNTMLIHYKKYCKDTLWQTKTLPFVEGTGGRFWENPLGQMYVLLAEPESSSAEIMSLDNYRSQAIAQFESEDPNLFITNRRSNASAEKRNGFDLVLFDSSSAQKALVFSVTLK